MIQAVVIVVGAALGQAAGQSVPANVDGTVEINSIWDFLLKGGPVMIPIGIASFAALAVCIERLWSLRRSVVAPAGFVEGLTLALGPERDQTKALAYCQAHPSPLASILAAGVRSLDRPADVLEKRIAEAGEREVFNLRKYLRVLALVASVATLLGLLGTITGMIQAFQTVATSGDALGRTELLAKGIYEAMITTAVGLIVAIPTTIAHHYFTARIEHLVHELDGVCVGFVAAHGASRPIVARMSAAVSAPAETVDAADHDGAASRRKQIAAVAS